MAEQVSCFERMFKLYVKPNITYKTAKKIKIFDWRLVSPKSLSRMANGVARGVNGLMQYFAHLCF